MTRHDANRLLTRVARLYYEEGLKQTSIAARLSLSQTRVSRLLRDAVDLGIVSISVRVPVGVHPDVEDQLEKRFGLREAIVVDTAATEERVMLRELGQACAHHLDNTLATNEVIGISAWSATLLETVNAMRPVRTESNTQVVQILGGTGSPTAEIHAAELTRRMALVRAGDATLLPAPGVVGSPQARRVLEADSHVQSTLRLFGDLTVALVGIGSVVPSRGLISSGNAFSEAELAEVAALGAVGDVCLRFFDASGEHVASSLDDRVLAITYEQLRKVPRVVAVAGGKRKVGAIRGALSGQFLSVLVTDHNTAQDLLS